MSSESVPSSKSVDHTVNYGKDILNALKEMERRSEIQRGRGFAEVREAQAETNIRLTQLNGTVATNCKVIDVHSAQLSSMREKQTVFDTAQAVMKERCAYQQDEVLEVQGEAKSNRAKIGSYAGYATGCVGLGVVIAELIHLIP